MCCWYLILTTPTGPAMRPNDPNGPTNVDIAKPQILISWQGARLEVLWCLRNGWIWSRHSNWKQWQKANQQLHRSQTSHNFFYSPSPSPLYNYLHFIYTICIYLKYFFHCASIIFPWSPASSQHPGARPQASLSVHFGAPSGPHELGRYLCSCASSRWPKAWPGTQGCPNLSGSSCAGSRWF
jgi:hypothetical protein